jgi:CRISPR-associated endonuclease/helicase Cas3
MGEAVKLFRDFFRAVHHVEPFNWQVALAERVLEGDGWPSAVDVPTGFGKTAAIDIAIVALAAQADRAAAERTAPTRIFVVVDRRLLVDQAYERACHIQAALDAPADDAVRWVAGRLRSISGGGRPLEVVRMRGGVTWSWRWLRSPAQPAVVAGTVDQYGSRFLFRGYGVGERLRPIDSALCGIDALLILDEAHLSTALATTVERAQAIELGVERALLRHRRSRPILLSATLRREEIEGREVFKPDLRVETSDAARRRLKASRRLVLTEARVAAETGPSEVARILASFAIAAVGRSRAPERVGVVANTVAVAREAFRSILGSIGDRVDAYLLIGRCRGFEREQLGLAKAVREVFGAVDSRPRRDRPAVLVATQTIEVGADLDLDYLITESAPLDALLQRLGRLNRLGLQGEAEAVCLFAPAVHTRSPVYGDAIARTWDWLRSRVSGDPPRVSARNPSASGAPWLEVGLEALPDVVDASALQACAMQRPDIPVVVRPHIEAWARTSPSPDPDQPVEPFIHGLDRGTPEVSVAWRAALPTLDAWRAELRVMPLRDEERVDLPLWAARRFLGGLGSGPLADLEGPTEPVEELGSNQVRRAVVQHLDGSVEWLFDPGRLMPGDAVILETEAGGHDGWGWTGEPGTVADVADLVARLRPAIRVRPTLLAWATGEDPADFRSRLSETDASAPDVVVSLLREAAQLARSRPDANEVLRLWAAHADGMADRILDGQAQLVRPDAERWSAELGYVVVARGRNLADHQDDDEEASTSSAAGVVELVRHGLRVGELARSFAERIGLPQELVETIQMAGRLHDVGKGEQRFQLMLHRGERERFEASGAVLAKSGMDPSDRAAFRRARLQAGVPKNWRHEALSAILADRYLAARDGVLDRDLLTHLVAAHHGFARPLFPPCELRGPVRLTLPQEPHDSPEHQLGAGVAEMTVATVDWRGPLRFALLCRRYGWWGLALMESVVRLADMAASEEGS